MTVRELIAALTQLPMTAYDAQVVIDTRYENDSFLPTNDDVERIELDGDLVVIYAS